MKTLKLFNSVVANKNTKNLKPIVTENGIIIDSHASWAKTKIINYYKKEKLSGNDLNKTFHKSWKKIKNSSRYELLVEQINHYVSTYGSDFQDEMYIPDEVLNVPELKLKYKVIRSYTKEEMIEKCLDMLRSGIALKEETIDDIFSILIYELDYNFTGKEGIKNKEANIKLADMYGLYPENTMEFFRYIIYKATGESLLIKNKKMEMLIKQSSFNPSIQFKNFGLEKMAEIFNRFKPLFLSFKSKCPATINKISNLSKKNHKPLVSNPLNLITSRKLTNKDLHWLENSSVYNLFKAIQCCYTRVAGQDSFVYRIRNGKSYTVTDKKSNIEVCEYNLEYVTSFLFKKYSLKGKKFYIPNGVDYNLPTSEKMFVGNVPTGTKFSAKRLCIGTYWENDWGARDLDLSSLNIHGKVGWNASYSQGNDLHYSGDITDAENGAIEYLYANKKLNVPSIVKLNVYRGEKNSGYKVVIGKGDKINKDYMMNPNKVFAEIKCETIQEENVVGIILPESNGQSFVLLNFGSGNCIVSGKSDESIRALYQQYSDMYTFNNLIDYLDGELVDNKEDADYDLSLDALEKDTFVNIFKG